MSFAAHRLAIAQPQCLHPTNLKLVKYICDVGNISTVCSFCQTKQKQTHQSHLVHSSNFSKISSVPRGIHWLIFQIFGIRSHQLRATVFRFQAAGGAVSLSYFSYHVSVCDASNTVWLHEDQDVIDAETFSAVILVGINLLFQSSCNLLTKCWNWSERSAHWFRGKMVPSSDTTGHVSCITKQHDSVQKSAENLWVFFKARNCRRLWQRDF